MIDRQTAIRRLTNRWHEQVEHFPLMRHEIPLDLYIRANLGAVLKSELEDPLADYANRN